MGWNWKQVESNIWIGSTDDKGQACSVTTIIETGDVVFTADQNGDFTVKRFGNVNDAKSYADEWLNNA